MTLLVQVELGTLATVSIGLNNRIVGSTTFKSQSDEFTKTTIIIYILVIQNEGIQVKWQPNSVDYFVCEEMLSLYA